MRQSTFVVETATATQSKNKVWISPNQGDKSKSKRKRSQVNKRKTSGDGGHIVSSGFERGLRKTTLFQAPGDEQFKYNNTKIN